MTADERWQTAPSNTFKKLYRAKDPGRKKRTQEVINALCLAENPLTLGEKKRTGLWTAEISSGDRLAYTVDFSGRIIYLIKVCSHKEVYGRD